MENIYISFFVIITISSPVLLIQNADDCKEIFKPDHPYSELPVRVMDCKRKTFKKFPNEIDIEGIDHLDLSYNMIEKLKPPEKSRKLQLKRLDLSNNKIYLIEPLFFDSMSNLEELYLDNNEIATFVNNGVFQSLTNLKILTLQRNGLATSPEGIFSPLVHLKVLDLSFNYIGPFLMEVNDITSRKIGLSSEIEELSLNNLDLKDIPKGFFEKLHELKYVSLANNPIENIPVLSHNLTYLDLSGTNIKELSAKELKLHRLKTLKLNRLKRLQIIDHYAFYNLQSLEELQLDHCPKLSKLEDLAFGIVNGNESWSLKKLSMVGSGLKGINDTYLKFFNRLDSLDLRNNPWDCNCNILWMKNILTLATTDTLRCETPASLLYKNVMKLSERNIYDCNAESYRIKKTMIGVLTTLIVMLTVLIVYLIYLAPIVPPNRHWNRKYCDIAPDSPYNNEMCSFE